MFYDMLGKSGLAHHPSQIHFHPEIKAEFAKVGIVAAELPPSAHELSSIEPINGRLQREVRCWEKPGGRPDPTQPRRRLIGPQDFYEAQEAVSAVLKRWRETTVETKSGQKITLMEKYCAAGYEQRDRGKELEKLWASSPVYQEVKRLRAVTPRGARAVFSTVYCGLQAHRLL